MKENIEELRANVERTEMAGLKFIATRVACARAALDYIAQLEQTSRAQRTTEGKCNSAAAPAAGQAGLAKGADIETAIIARVQAAICDANNGADIYMASLIAARNIIEAGLAAPVAADTEQAIPEGWKLVPVAPTAEMLVAGVESEDKDFGLIIHNCYCAMIAAAPAAPLATPADAGAGLTDEEDHPALIKVMGDILTTSGWEKFRADEEIALYPEHFRDIFKAGQEAARLSAGGESEQP